MRSGGAAACAGPDGGAGAAWLSESVDCRIYPQMGIFDLHF